MTTSEELLDLVFGSEPGDRTKPETLARRRQLYDIVSASAPMGVRQIFYQATVLGIGPKTEKFARLVGADLCRMRESRIIPYEWISDETRWVMRPQTFTGVKAALDDVAKNYRKSLWHGSDCQVQIWLEKIGLAATIDDVTDKYDVPLRPARGFSSMTFLYNAAKELEQYDVPIFIYHFGDFDPSGVSAARNIEKDIREHAPDADVHFERVAVTEDQIRGWNLPTRPTKETDNRGNVFVSDVSVELDATPPQMLRGLVEMVIRRHITDERYNSLMKEEAKEKKQITDFVAKKGKSR